MLWASYPQAGAGGKCDKIKECKVIKHWLGALKIGLSVCLSVLKKSQKNYKLLQIFPYPDKT